MRRDTVEKALKEIQAALELLDCNDAKACVEIRSDGIDLILDDGSFDVRKGTAEEIVDALSSED